MLNRNRSHAAVSRTSWSAAVSLATVICLVFAAGVPAGACPAACCCCSTPTGGADALLPAPMAGCCTPTASVSCAMGPARFLEPLAPPPTGTQPGLALFGAMPATRGDGVPSPVAALTTEARPRAPVRPLYLLQQQLLI